MCLIYKINVNHIGQFGDSALILATKNGHEKIVNTLIAHGANINDIDEFGSSLLILAAKKGHEKIVTTLLTMKVNINHQNHYGNTALIIAAANNHLAITTTLLAHDAIISYENKNRNTALMLAMENNHFAIAIIIKKMEQLQNETLVANKKIINKINIILSKTKKRNYWKHAETKIIKIIKTHELNINKKCKNLDAQLTILLKTKFINNWKLESENYSLLDIAALNNWQQLATYLITKWPINIDTKTLAWEHACLLLHYETAIIIKDKKNTNEKDNAFIKNSIDLPSKKSFSNETKEINKLTSENRNNIINYYSTENEKNTINTQNIKLITKNKIGNNARM